jgi:hypothetical protein
MKWKPPHGFCTEAPCRRAWHPTEGHLSVVPISIRFGRFTVFHTSSFPEGYDLLGKKLGSKGDG